MWDNKRMSGGGGNEENTYPPVDRVALLHVEPRQGSGEVTAMKVEYEKTFTVTFYIAKILGILIAVEIVREVEKYVLWITKSVRRIRKTKLEGAGR